MLRELEIEQPENAELKSFDYDFFKRMLVRIAALGQFKLGGQKQALLEAKLEEENDEREKQKQLKEKML